MENSRVQFTPDQVHQLKTMAASFKSKAPLSVEQVNSIKSLGNLNPKSVDDFFIQEVGTEVYKKGLRITASYHPKLVNWVVSPPSTAQIENNDPTDIESCIESRLKSVIRGNYNSALAISNALEKMHDARNRAEYADVNTLVEYYQVVMIDAQDLVRCGLDKILYSPEMVKIALRTTYYLEGEIKRGSSELSATVHFMQAAELGCSQSQETEEVKCAKEHGMGDKEALHFLRRKANSGDAASCYQVGQFLEKLGANKDALVYYYKGTSGGVIPYRDMLQRAKLLEQKQPPIIEPLFF